MPARVAAALYGAWMVALAAVFWLVPAGETPARALVGVSAAVAIGWGVRRYQPSERLPWRLLAVALALSGIGTAAYDAPGHLRGLDVGGAALITTGYPALAAVLLLFIRRRGDRNRAAVLDSLVLTSGIALLAWTFVLGDEAPDAWAALVFPLGDLLCLGMLLLLLISFGRVVPAGLLLGAGLVGMLAGDAAYDPAGLGRFVLCAAAGFAALHPSMTELTRPAQRSPGSSGRTRLVLLGAASMVAPAILLLTEGSATALLSALTFLLVLIRTAEVMARHRAALDREMALREASAALVSAVDVDAVDAAVRTAVGRLLPAGTEHGVVLAMPVAEVADTDPAARVVPIRDVDWAVAVRLPQLPAVLRCPMLLPERPTGDPLVGVLHVAAPAIELRGLHRAVEVLAGQAALALERIGLSQEVIRRNSETYFRTLVQNAADVILIVDETDRIRYASPSAVTVFDGDPTGVLLPEIFHPDDRVRLGEAQTDLRSITGVLLEAHCRDLRADRTVAGLVFTLRDVTEQRRLEQELTHQAFHDAMTGLANRVLFHDRLQHALARGARDGSVVGVLFIDLDDFKTVNDTYGHAAGDILLTTVARRIAAALRADDTAARLGGDEFAALVENVQDPGAVEETAHRILAALAHPIHLDDGTVLTAAASIGITTTPEADSADELLRQADLALYVAKGAGKNQWRRYQAHLHGAMVERLELRSALDHAVHEGHFLLVYQPIVDLASDEPVGFEALVRWHHPTRGVVAPAEFIAVAEESGLIVPIGRWVLRQALHTVAQWWQALPRTRRPYLSVNVSVRQFREPGFVDEVLQELAFAGVPPHALMLEITETLLVGDNEPIWQDLASLRAHGVRIAIDDFGTGYSSLGYLRQRPIDVVKIDKMFIDDITEGEQQMALVAGIVSLAQSLGLTVVAEGIESRLHREMLARLGCPLGQGYLFSSPVDGTEALSQLTRLVGIPLTR